MKSLTSKLSSLLLVALVVLGVFFAGQQRANAYLIILDMDISTPPPPGPPGPLPGPAGPATGFDPAIGVLPGSTVTVIAYVVSTGSGASLDTIGIDLSFGAPGDTATVSATGPNLAGLLAGTGSGSAPPFSVDLGAPPAVVPPGLPLTPLGLPALATYAGNFGGSGYFDGASPAPAPGGQFSGLGFAPPPGTYVDVMGFDVTVTGSPGDFVTLMPSGVFAPSAFAPGTVLGPGVPLAVGGDAVYDAVSGMTFPGAYAGGTIFLIPEPSGTALFGLAALGLLRRRR